MSYNSRELWYSNKYYSTYLGGQTTCAIEEDIYCFDYTELLANNTFV